MKGDNLPCAQDVVNLYESNNIGAMRLYSPDIDTLEAIKETNIKIMLDVANEDITAIGCDQSMADNWVETNVIPYAPSIKYIAVGNEIRPNYSMATFVEPAMRNIHTSLNWYDLATQIMVSTAIDTSLIQYSYPPSNTIFQNLTYITPIIKFLRENNSPLLVNIQPYIAYINDTEHITLDFVLFTSPEPVFRDNTTGKEYQNLFDATFDAVYTAVQKVDTPDIIFSNGNNNGANKMVVSETGHPSKKGFKNKMMYDNEGNVDAATVENAKTYYTNLIEHVKMGSPLTQGQPIETYLFAMFDENEKQGDGTEQHYGLFTPDGTPKYGQLNFCG
ncbi:unnamed protein product [Amaranthus hypochondriacus]